MAKVSYIYNINAPSEFTNDKGTGTLDIFSGDEYMLVAKFDDIDITFDVPFNQIGSYIKSKRNSLTMFKNLIMPCQGLSLHLREKDAVARFDDLSNTVKFECNDIGIQDHIFKIGDKNN